MYDFLSRIKQLPEWFHAAYITDWAVTFIFYGLTKWIHTVPVFERDFAAYDLMINHPHAKQRVNHLLIYALGLGTPSLGVIFIGALKRSSMSLHHGFLSLLLAVCSQGLIVAALKNRVGRLRPDFLSRCKWDDSLEACTGDLDAIRDGRRSFPSGHSSLAFSGLVFLALHIGSNVSAFRSRASSPRNFWRSRALSLSIALSPLVVATWIAITRLEDYRHYKEDVITGGLIGALCAYGSYRLYWYNPFSEGYGPRDVYKSDGNDTHPGYELTRVEGPAYYV